MTQHTFSPPLQSDYTLGKDLNLLPFELFNHVKAGKLHPFDKDTGQLILRPDVQRINDQHKKIMDEIKAMSFKGGKIDALYRGWKKEEEKQKLDSLGKELQKEHDAIVKELETITAIDDWTTYDPQEEPKHLITHLPIDLMKAFDILQNAIFKKSEVDQLNKTDGGQSHAKESAPSPQDEQAPETVVPKENSLDINVKEPLTEEQTEEIVRAMTVIRVSDTEIIIKHSNKEINATCEDMGFKSYAKPWKMFMDILQDRSNQYFIGRYDKVNQDNNKDYLRKAKLFGNFSKKFIEFINDKFSLSLPGDFQAFYNMKHKERQGLYRPKFRVDECQNTNQRIDIKNLSKEATLERLTALQKQYKGENDKAEKERILIEIGQYGNHAIKKHGIPEVELRSFFPLPDDTPSENDMMELISEFTQKDKDRLF